MCVGGGGSVDVPEAKPVTPAPVAQSAQVIQARDDETARRRRVASSTILTSPQGLVSMAPTQGKTLLGQ